MAWQGVPAAELGRWPFRAWSGRAAAPEAPAANPNLLLWSEAFDNGAWSKTSASVTPNAANDPGAVATAEEIALGATGAVRQISATAATTGVAVTATSELVSAYARLSVSGAFDGTVYVFSVYISEAIGGSLVRLRLDRSGGFLRCSIEGAGDALTIIAAWAKLETPDLTAYVKREGT